MKTIIISLLFFFISGGLFGQWKVEKSTDEFTEQTSIVFKLQAEKDPSTFLVLRKIPGASRGKIVFYSNLLITSTKNLGNDKVDVAIKLDSEPVVFEEWVATGGGKMLLSTPIYTESYEKDREALFSPKGMFGSSVDISPLLKRKTLEIKVDGPAGVLKFKFNLAGLKEAIEKNPGFFELPIKDFSQETDEPQ